MTTSQDPKPPLHQYFKPVSLSGLKRGSLALLTILSLLPNLLLASTSPVTAQLSIRMVIPKHLNAQIMDISSANDDNTRFALCVAGKGVGGYRIMESSGRDSASRNSAISDYSKVQYTTASRIEGCQTSPHSGLVALSGGEGVRNLLIAAE